MLKKVLSPAEVKVALSKALLIPVIWLFELAVIIATPSLEESVAITHSLDGVLGVDGVSSSPPQELRKMVGARTARSKKGRKIVFMVIRKILW
jgi:hypothetical protein